MVDRRPPSAASACARAPAGAAWRPVGTRWARGRLRRREHARQVLLGATMGRRHPSTPSRSLWPNSPGPRPRSHPTRVSASPGPGGKVAAGADPSARTNDRGFRGLHLHGRTGGLARGGTRVPPRELPPGFNWDSEYNEDEEGWEFALEFTRRLGAKGWIGLTWPTEYGGLGRPPIDRFILWEELAGLQCPGHQRTSAGVSPPTRCSTGGTHEQKLRFLPPIARMETFWAEGLTEPDCRLRPRLAAYHRRSRRRLWVVNGQKTYTTWGTHADVLYLAARTDPESPSTGASASSASTSRSPASSFSPLHNIAGGRQNHTYFDDVRHPGRHADRRARPRLGLHHGVVLRGRADGRDGVRHGPPAVRAHRLVPNRRPGTDGR